MPDYSLYPDMDYSLGFTTRGCIRKCPFCIVPQKEGNIRINADIYEFWNGRHKKVVLLDNNILALSNHFFKITDQIKKEDLKIDFNQGLDIRLLTSDHIEILKRLKPISCWRFAFDNLKEENIIKRGFDLLKKAGLKRPLIRVYMLIGFHEKTKEEAIQSALKRVKIIHDEYNFDPFAMPYNLDPRYKDIARWINHPAIINSVEWKDYKYNETLYNSYPRM